MPKKSWTIQLEDGTHTVEMDHNIFSNKRMIRVDSQVVEQGKFSAFDFGGDYPFRIGAHQAVLHMRMNGVQYKYDVSINGHSALTGKPVTMMQPMPKWVWVFVVACVVIPVVTLGGAIPALLGIGTAWICVAISRHPTLSTRTKVLLSLGATMLAWALLVAFIPTVTGGRTLLTLGQPNWQEHQSQAGRYSVLMPGKPKEQMQSMDSDIGTLELHIALFEDRSGAYMVAYVDYPVDLVQFGILDGVEQSIATNIDGKLTRQIDFPLGAYPGREAELAAPAQGARPAVFVKIRYFLVSNRLYQLMVTAPQSQGLPDAAQKFFDSFKLIED
ncbi:MAG TPA: hypothetical protein VLG46_00370 [Anaerolineae bacterium]|nr:hypothetical protein [Anaerolineae bacterium]